MECVKCGQEIMEGVMFCPYCGEKVAGEKAKEDKPIYQVDVKGMRKTGKLSVYHDRTEFATSSVQKTIYNYSGLVAVKKRMGLGLDHIDFVTEDGRTESCDVNRKSVHEAFMYIEKAARPYIAERKKCLLSQGIRYSVVSSAGLTEGILDIFDSKAEFKSKSGQRETVPFQEVKSARTFKGIKSVILEFSFYDGRSKAFGIDQELQEEIFSFVKQAIVPYIQERKEALLAKGIYFSCLSSRGSDSGILNILKDRAEFTAKSGEGEVVYFKEVRDVHLLTEMLEFFLTDGTSRAFAVEGDIREEALSFIEQAIQPYVLKRTVGFDMTFGIDERIEVNEARGVFHVIRQGGNEITEECPLTALVQCEQIESSESSGVLDKGIDIFHLAVKAVGAQGTPDTDEKISYVGVLLTIGTEEGQRTETVRFGDFFVRMSRTNEKYDPYLAEVSRFMDYLNGNYPECRLVVPALPEPESEYIEIEGDTAEEKEEITADPVKGQGDPLGIVSAAAKKEQSGIAKYIDGVSGFIDSSTTPMTIAIQGSQGNDKNGIMKMLFDSLAENYPNDRIWFDTRFLLHSNSEEPLPVLVGKKLISQLSSTDGDGSKERAVKITKSLLELLTGIVASDSQIGRNLAEGLFKEGSVIPPEKLVDVFNELVKERVSGLDGRVIILINELDKLPPKKAVELLKVLQDYFDCEGCVFIAAIDYSFFLRGMEKPGQDFDEQKAKLLFDEMFQMSFRVPASGCDIQSYVKGKLEHMGIYGGDKTELEFYVELIKGSVGCEPRNMNRLFNSFLLLKNMADKELYENKLKRLILFALLCMQTRFHGVYDRLKQIKEKVTPDLLSGLCGEESEVVAHTGLSEEETAEFRGFARTLCDIINADNTEDISPFECGVFAQVLEFSSITSK